MLDPYAQEAVDISRNGIVTESIRKPLALRHSWWENVIYAVLLSGVDCVAILVSFLAAYFFRSSLLRNFGAQLTPFVPVEPYLETSWMILLWPGVFFYDGLYERGIGNWDEQIRLLKGVCFGGILAMGATFVLHAGSEYSRAVLIGTCLAAAVIVPAFRAYFKFRMLTYLFPVRILLLTNKHLGQQAVTEGPLLANLGYKVLKTVLVEGNQEEAELRDSIYDVTADLGADEIILDVRQFGEENFRKTLRCAEATGVPVKVLSALSVFQLRARVRNLDGLILFDLNSGLARPFSRVIKRTMDLAGALILLIVLAPLFLLVAILVKMESPGPAFYRHCRLDFRGQNFRCWKFRTMYRNAEEWLRHWIQTGDQQAKEFEIQFKLKDDPRVTRIGRLLRRTSLDELPQLLNVLRGEMSLIGPRPIVLEEIPKYGNDVQYLRMAKGGMTGIWQVSGRNDTDYSHRIALDIYYVRNWSVWLDVVTLLKTVWVVLRRSGAY